MENTILFLFCVENILIILFLIVFYYRKKIYWKDLKKYLFRLQPNPPSEIAHNKKVYVEQKIFIETPDVGVYKMKLYRIKRHKHTIVNSLLYITKGKAKVIVGIKKYFVKSGSFIFIPSNTYHEWKVCEPYKFVEYIEVASPSFAYTSFRDNVWAK